MATASLSTHVLDTGAGHPAPGVTVELTYGGAVVRWAQTDGDGRAHLGDELAPGIYRLAFASPRLAVLVRELPRQLSSDELAALFEGRTRFVERLAREPDPLTRAATLVLELPHDEQVEI